MQLNQLRHFVEVAREENSLATAELYHSADCVGIF